MYNVRVKRYTVSHARERLADVLDEAERTGSILIQRGDREYVITPKRRTRAAKPQSVIEVLDPAIDAGAWTWDLTASGLRFRPRARRRS